jgi:hypothetical protein
MTPCGRTLPKNTNGRIRAARRLRSGSGRVGVARWIRLASPLETRQGSPSCRSRAGLLQVPSAPAVEESSLHSLSSASCCSIAVAVALPHLAERHGTKLYRWAIERQQSSQVGEQLARVGRRCWTRGRLALTLDAGWGCGSVSRPELQPEGESNLKDNMVGWVFILGIGVILSVVVALATLVLLLREP